MRKLCVLCKVQVAPSVIHNIPVWNCPQCGTLHKSEIAYEASRYFTAYGENYERKLQRVLRVGDTQ